jgi:nitrogen fixation protein NifU and related proteins
MAKYPRHLLEHFQNPKNVGEILDPDGVGIACNASCGDIMQMFIKCNGDKILEVTFKAFGCGAAIAACSILSEEIKGFTIGEALKISEGVLEAASSQLPQEKITCFKLAVNALRLAIEEYRSKQPEPSLREGFQKDIDQS